MVSTTRAAYTSAIPPPGKRPHSITVFGCTGNAGRGVAYHAIKSSVLKQNNNNDKHNVRIALSGRNRSKVQKVLEGIHDELQKEGIQSKQEGNNNNEIEIIVADANDEQSMLNLAQSTDILISCAGPFARYGEAAVRACVEARTHYVDIAGEEAWVSRMISDYGAVAEERGVTLCPFGGYDCVPAELGMYLVGEALESMTKGEEGGGGGATKSLGTLELNFRGTKGGFPRGTIETILDSLEGKVPQRKEGDVRFYPKQFRSVAKEALSTSHWLIPRYQMGQFTGPNFMSVINVPVMCRTASTLGYSNNISIHDKSVFGGRPSLMNGYGLLGTQLYIATLFVGGMALALPPVRAYLRRKMKNYGFDGNPSGKVYLDARGVSADETRSALARCVVPGDAGIYATGLLAAGVANALHEAITSSTTTTASSATDGIGMPLAGFHAPVAALHTCRRGLLVDHLKGMGVDISVRVVPEGGVAKELDATTLRSKL
eukprot:CAMPEP_0183732602 /NCGR_PEP_ID=MMETSP0737-20130205/38852_1 /TAXON_ID=385413 /ORGANISM="Thalassiosira miniscula, Strain CCMP1093" /LENGTH=487 /DNA_ID=CAMNT_0025965653 /DNA_START=66 /DNA_END=1529 /DNA_ORIENTATION=-